MTRLDKQKWDRRYYRGFDVDRSQPSEWLLRCLSICGFPRGADLRALDVACGAGRNALYLAALGFSVDAVDISSVALAQALLAARERELRINWIEADLDLPFRPPRSYDLIVMTRYLNLPLLDRLLDGLKPGGWLVCEEHLQSTAAAAGPRRAEYRVAPGALAAACSRLLIHTEEEGTIRDPDGRTVAVARVLVQRPMGDA